MKFYTWLIILFLNMLAMALIAPILISAKSDAALVVAAVAVIVDIPFTLWIFYRALWALPTMIRKTNQRIDALQVHTQAELAPQPKQQA